MLGTLTGISIAFISMRPAFLGWEDPGSSCFHWMAKLGAGGIVYQGMALLGGAPCSLD